MYTVLAFDFDNSMGKAFIGQFDGKKIRYEERKRFEIKPIPEKKILCWDFFSIIKEVTKTIQESGDIDSVAFDTWGRDYGLIVKHKYLMHLPFASITSRIKRVSPTVFKQISPEDLYRATGNQIMLSNTLFQLMAEKGKSLDSEVMLFMSDLFAWALCGNCTVDYTNASTSQLMNPLTGNWNYNITRYTPFSFSIFPEIISPGRICGSYNGIAVAKVAGHNIQSAVAAIPCSGSDEFVFLYDGATPVIGCELDNPILTKMGMDAGLSNEIGANGKFNCLKRICGRKLILDIVKAFNTEGKKLSDTDVARMAKQESMSSCFIDPDTPEFSASNDVLEKIRKYCEQTGQIVPKTDGEYIRCAYDSIAMKCRYAIEQIQNITEKAFKSLYILGKGATDEVFCQTTADVLGIPVIAGPAEAAAIGNILLQLIALRAVNNVNEGRKIILRSEKITTYRPQASNDTNEKYQLFCDILHG